MTINKQRKTNPHKPKGGHRVEFNKKGRHPYKRNPQGNPVNLEDFEDEYENWFDDTQRRRQNNDNLSQ
jgi:hypothetical protein